MFVRHEIVHFNLKAPWSVVAISCPDPPINALTVQSTVMYGNIQFVPRKVLRDEPVDYTLTAFLAVVVPRSFKCQHQNSALSATSDTLTPQCVIQTKDVTKINLSSVEYLIGLCVSSPIINHQPVLHDIW